MQDMTSYSLGFDGSVINVSDGSDGCVTIEHFKVGRQGTIEKCNQFSWVTKVKVEVLAAAVVCEVLTSRTIPVVAVGSKTKDKQCDCYLLYIDCENRKCVPLQKFTVTNSITFLTRWCVVRVVDGPSIIIHDNQFVHFFESKFEPVLKEYRYSLANPGNIDDNETPNKLMLVYFQEISDSYFIFFRVGSETTEANASENNFSMMCVTFQEHYFAQVDLNCLIPREYHCNVSALLVKHITPSSDSYLSEILIGTLEGFVIYLCNGNIHKCVQVFEESPVSYINTGGAVVDLSSEAYIVGSSNSYKALDNNLNAMLEDLQGQHVFRADFLRTGTEQFLLLDGQVTEDTRCMITDLKTHHVFPNRSRSEPDDIADLDSQAESCSQKAVTALTRRCQKDRLLCNKEIQSVRASEEFLCRTFKQQLHLAAGSFCSTQHQSGLLSLVKGQTEPASGANISQPVSPGTCTELKVNSIWYKTYTGQLCIGVDVTCDTECHVMVWVDIVSDTSDDQVSSRSTAIVFKQQQRQRPSKSHNAMATKTLQCSAKHANEDSRTMADSASSDSDSDISFPKQKKIKKGNNTNSSTGKVKGVKQHKTGGACVQSNTDNSITYASTRPNATNHLGSNSSAPPDRQSSSVHLNTNTSKPVFSQTVSQCDLEDTQNVTKEGTILCTQSVPKFSNKSTVQMNVILNWRKVGGGHKVDDLHFKANDKVTSRRPNSEADLDMKGRKKDPAHSHKQNNGMGDVAMETGPVTTETCNRIYTRCCGQVVLNVDDVLSWKHELNLTPEADNHEDVTMTDFTDVKHSRLALWHIQTLWQLEIQCSPGVLCRLEDLLTNRCGFWFSGLYDCYVLGRGSGPGLLSNVQVKLGAQTSSGRRDLCAYTSVDSDLYLLLHHLYSKLPDHVTIVVKEMTADAIKATCFPALQKEVYFLSDGLRKLLNDHAAASRQASVDSDRDSDSDVVKIAERFKRKRETLLRKQSESLNVSSKVSQQFHEDLINIQSATDTAMSASFFKM